jgi:diaminopimelate epimerase
MSKIPFVKAVASGNDFVMVDVRKSNIPFTGSSFKSLANRHWGIGCDQIILLSLPTVPGAEARLTFYNADGTLAEACGNGTRCAALLLMQQKQTKELFLQMNTLVCHAFQEDDHKRDEPKISVTMGSPRFGWQDIPLSHATSLHDVKFEGMMPLCVNVGNPHALFFVHETDAVLVESIGSYIENHFAFPERTNVGFIQVINDHTLVLRVWERGSGLTLACGTGACAAAVVAIIENRVVSSSVYPIKVIQRGGECLVHWQQGKDIILTGSAHLVFDGTIDMEKLSTMNCP